MKLLQCITGIAHKMPVGMNIKQRVSDFFSGPQSVSCKMSFQLFMQEKIIPSYTYAFLNF